MSSTNGGSWVNRPGDRKSRENCERVQREAVPIEGTVGERYLVEQRGLQHPLWSQLRWLPDARTGEGAVVAPLTVDGEIVGYQATFIDALGRKSVINPARETWKFDEKQSPSAVFAVPVRGNPDEIVIADGLEDAAMPHESKYARVESVSAPSQGSHCARRAAAAWRRRCAGRRSSPRVPSESMTLCQVLPSSPDWRVPP